MYATEWGRTEPLKGLKQEHGRIKASFMKTAMAEDVVGAMLRRRDGREKERTMRRRVRAPREWLKGPGTWVGLKRRTGKKEVLGRRRRESSIKKRGSPRDTARFSTHSAPRGAGRWRAGPCPPLSSPASVPIRVAERAESSEPGDRPQQKTLLMSRAWAVRQFHGRPWHRPGSRDTSVLIQAWCRHAPISQSEVMPGPALLGRGMKP